MLAKRVIRLSVVIPLACVASGFAMAQVLPTAIEVCDDEGRCKFNTSFLPLDLNGAVTFAFYSESGVEKVLLRYEVEGTIENTFGVSQTFRDLVWLSVGRQYDINSFNEHAMTLFGVGTDAAIPLPLGLNYEHLIRFSTGGLLAGQGDTGLLGLLRNPPPVAVPTMFDYPLTICLAEGCYAQADLNLVGVEFQPEGEIARFVPRRLTDLNDGILLTRTTGFEGDESGNGAFEETLTVRIVPAGQVVPEPATGLVASIAGLLVVLGRRQSAV